MSIPSKNPRLEEIKKLIAEDLKLETSMSAEQLDKLREASTEDAYMELVNDYMRLRPPTMDNMERDNAVWWAERVRISAFPLQHWRSQQPKTEWDVYSAVKNLRYKEMSDREDKEKKRIGYYQMTHDERRAYRKKLSDEENLSAYTAWKQEHAQGESDEEKLKTMYDEYWKDMPRREKAMYMASFPEASINKETSYEDYNRKGDSVVDKLWRKRYEAFKLLENAA
jgi:hypothetical protein